MSIWGNISKRSEGGMERAEEAVANFVEGDSLEILTTLNDMLKKGVVHFVYVKKNGEVRDAWGTKFTPYIEKIPHNGGTYVPMKRNHMRYFDVEAADWRTCDPTRLQGFYDKVYDFDQYEKAYSKYLKDKEKAKEEENV